MRTTNHANQTTGNVANIPIGSSMSSIDGSAVTLDRTGLSRVVPTARVSASFKDLRGIVNVVLNSTALHEMDMNHAVLEILIRKLIHEHEATIAGQNERIRLLEYENNFQKGAIHGYEFLLKIRDKDEMTDSLESALRTLQIEAFHAKAFDALSFDDTFDSELDSLASDSNAFDAFDTFDTFDSDSNAFDAFESQPLDAFSDNAMDANAFDAAYTMANKDANSQADSSTQLVDTRLISRLPANVKDTPPKSHLRPFSAARLVRQVNHVAAGTAPPIWPFLSTDAP
jgi:hypothetical protein